MIHSIIKSKFVKKAVAAILITFFWLSAWQLISIYLDNALLVVSPLTVFKRLFQLSKELTFWKVILTSFYRIAAGFLTGTLAGILLAAISYKFKIIYLLIKPLMNIVRATPVASFIIFLWVWSKNTNIPIIISFLMVLPIVFGNVLKGIEQTDKKLLEMAKVFQLTNYKKTSDIYLPSIKPFFISAAINAIGLAWKAGIAAEVLCRPKNSIGSFLQDSKIYLETADLFAWTLTVIIISMVLEAVMVKLLNKMRGDFSAKD